MLKMASSIRRFVFVVLVSALLANAFPMDNLQDAAADGDIMESAVAAADSTSQETAKRSSDLSNENESEMALRNADEKSRNKILVQKLSNILRELKEAKLLSNERASLRDMIFAKQNNNVEEVEEPQQKQIYKGNFQKNKLDYKRDCHLGLGMGYLCHAYSITKYAQHHKLMQDPRNPGK